MRYYKKCAIYTYLTSPLCEHVLTPDMILSLDVPLCEHVLTPDMILPLDVLTTH